MPSGPAPLALAGGAGATAVHAPTAVVLPDGSVAVYYQRGDGAAIELATGAVGGALTGRGPGLQTEAQGAAGLAGTGSFISDVYAGVQAGAAAGKDLNAVYRETMAALRPKYGHWVIFDHCMPFDVSRAYDEATAHRDPRIWTAERDVAMWKALES